MDELVSLVGLPAETPDLPGHGDAAYSCDADGAVAVLAESLRACGTRATLVGYSQGGRMALLAALAVPDLVKRLVLVSASPGLQTSEERVRRREADEVVAESIERDFSEFLGAWAQQFSGVAERGDAWVTRDLAQRSTNTAEGLAEALRGYGQGAQPSAWERLDELMMPVTLVSGSRDGKYRCIAEEMAVHIANVELVVLEGGHALVGENPWALASVIRRRLEAE